VARLSVSPSSGTAPLTVTASGSASSDADGSIASYRFDFGDGTVVGPQASATATHTFAAGTWTVRLTVTDNQGATGSASAVVTVTAPNQAPVAVFTVLPNSGIAPLPVTASGAGSFDPDGSIASYRFDFGDGTVAGPLVLATTAHIYSAGTWTARLTVTDNRGATATASVVVTVQPGLPLIVAGPASQGPPPTSVPSARPPLDEPQPPSQTSDAVVGPAGNYVRVRPDPLGSAGQIELSTPVPGPVSVGIFDIGGRSVRIVADQTWAPAGAVTFAFDGRDAHGAPLPRGIYFVTLKSPTGRRTARFVVVR
jgi:PKD repeat protein